MDPQFVTCITLAGDQHDISIVQIEAIVLEGARCASSFDRDEPLFFVVDGRSDLVVHLGNYAECDWWIEQRAFDNHFAWDRYSVIPVEERMS